MFDNDYNIQCRPTPTLFEKIASRDISPKIYTSHSNTLIASDLHGVIVAIGSFIAKTATSSCSLVTSELRSVIVPIGTYIGKTITSSCTIISSSLVTVIKPTPPANAPTPVTSNCQLTASALTTVVKSVGTFSINASSNCSLVSSALV